MDSSLHLDGDSTGDFQRSVEATAEAAYTLRELFTLWVTATVDADTERRGDIVLAVYEAVANATEHAYKDTAAPGTVTVRSRHRPNGVLEITVTDTGTWDPSPSERFRGRGLALITVLSDTNALTTGPDGTTVTMCWQPMRDCRDVITYIIGTLKPAGGQALLLESDITWTEVGHELGLFHTCSNDLMADNDGARGTSYTPTGLTRGLYRNKWGL